MSARRVALLAGVLAAGLGSFPVVAQVKTNVPDVVAGAQPAVVERITIHGPGLEGNLEGNAVDLQWRVRWTKLAQRSAKPLSVKIAEGERGRRGCVVLRRDPAWRRHRLLHC